MKAHLKSIIKDFGHSLVPTARFNRPITDSHTLKALSFLCEVLILGGYSYLVTMQLFGASKRAFCLKAS
jgi:hypothetical protein